MSSNKDPLIYIFKIIKYIIEKDTSHNNSENIVKAFGKSVGSKLRNEKYTHVNLLINKDWITTEFINILSITDITKSIDYNLNYKFHTILFNLNDIIIKLEIYSDIRLISKWIDNNLKNCIPQIYFTCDNLAIDINGNISNIRQSISKNYDTCDTITKSITDAIYKKFSIINSTIDYKQNISLLIDINQKYSQMINEGFTYVPNLNNIIFKNYKDIKSYCERDISTNCAICCEEYCHEKINDTVLLKCLHDFHIECLYTWIKKNNNKCPLCRLDIDFQPQTKYGDNMIDNIIENYI